MPEDLDELHYDDLELEETSYKHAKPEKPKKSFGKILGMLIIILSIGGIGANEFMSGSEDIPTIRAESAQSENNNKLVYLNGELSSGEFTDPMFKITSKGLSLERIVEMYQWVEDGGQYTKKWANKLIDISSEDAKSKGYVNPPEMPFASDKWQVDEVKAGIFTLSPGLAKQAMLPEALPLTNDDFSKLDADGQAAFKLHNGAYFFGIDPENPHIGDLKVSFMRAAGGKVSILAQQKGASLMPYENGSANIEKLFLGEKSLPHMSEGIDVGGSGIVKWLVRIGGGIMAFLGLIIMFKSRTPKKAKPQKPQMAKFEYPMAKKAAKKNDKKKLKEEAPKLKDKNEEIAEPVEDIPFEDEEDFNPAPIMPSINKKKSPSKIAAIAPVLAAAAPILEETITATAQELAPPESFDDDFDDMPETPAEGASNNIPESLEMEVPFLDEVDEEDDDEEFAEDFEEELEEELPENIELIDGELPDFDEENYATQLPEAMEFETVEGNVEDDEDDFEDMPAGIEMIGPDGIIEQPNDTFPEDFEDEIETNAEAEYEELPDIEFITGGETGSPAENIPNLPPPLEFKPQHNVAEPEFIEEEEIQATPEKVPPLPPPPFLAKKKAEEKLPTPPNNGFDLGNIPDDFDPHTEMASDEESEFDPFADDEDMDFSPFDTEKK
jgi:hypothetical protein